MPWLRLYGTDLPKNTGRASEKARNHGFHLQWEEKLATIISKLYEHYILACISPLLATTDNQFGFKPKHGTDMCIFLLKQTVSYYVNKDTPVFSAFLVKHLKHLIELTTTYFLLN